MNNKLVSLTVSVLSGLLIALVLLLAQAQFASLARADPEVLYVAPDGTCEGASPCFAHVQAAVDAATGGDEIRIATGVYTDVNVRPRIDVTITGVVTQVIYLSKTLILRGGYTTTNWITPGLAANPTVLDAQEQGRVIYIAGDITSTLEGLRLTRGNANAPGLGDYCIGSDCYGNGGGLYGITATVILSNCQIDHNTAWSGSGLYLSNSDATLITSTIHDNAAYYSGGGLTLDSSNATLSANTLLSNSATWFGGGMMLSHSPARMTGNMILSNTTTYGDGGGLYLSLSDAMLIGNRIQDNVSNGTDKFTHGGGGVFLASSNATLNGNFIQSNTAQLSGGGVYLSGNASTLSGNSISGNRTNLGSGGGLFTAIDTSTLSSNIITGNQGGGVYLMRSQATLINNVVADNQADGIYIAGGAPQLLFNTVARNGSGNGVGVVVSTYIATGGHSYSSTTALTDTILVSHSVGISLTTGNTATINGILWSATPITLSQANSTTAIVHNQVEGDPAFDVDGFHLTAASPAIGAGVSTGSWPDIDHEPRRSPPDLGADEYWAPGALQKVYLPLILR